MKEYKEILNNKKKLFVTLLARTKISESCPVAYRLIKITDFQEMWICPYISRHLLSLNPLLACCRRYSRGER